MTPTPAVAGYSPLLAKAASNRPPEHDFVHDGLNAYEREVLEWADSRLFGNDNFLESRWGPGNWPTALGANFASDVERWADNFGINLDDPLSDEELRLASVQAVLLLMLEIDIEKQANGQHVVSWGVDGLDRVLDDLGVYPGMCVHCYGRSGYDTTEGLGQHYIVILGTGHVHREMLKTIAYLAKANGEGVLVRSFLDNDADDFDLLYKRKQEFMPSARGTGSFAYENVSFMSQIRLPDGTLQTYPTLAFSMVGNVATEREAVERVYDHIRKNVKHFTGDLDNFANLFRPHTVTPHIVRSCVPHQPVQLVPDNQGPVIRFRQLLEIMRGRPHRNIQQLPISRGCQVIQIPPPGAHSVRAGDAGGHGQGPRLGERCGLEAQTVASEVGRLSHFAGAP